MLRKRESVWMSAVRSTVPGSLALLTVLLALPIEAAEITPSETALNCNSNVEVRETGPSPSDPTGQTFMAMITVSNVESNNIGNVPQTQQFPVVTFFPSCTTTIPCVPARPWERLQEQSSSSYRAARVQIAHRH